MKASLWLPGGEWIPGAKYGTGGQGGRASQNSPSFCNTDWCSQTVMLSVEESGAKTVGRPVADSQPGDSGHPKATMHPRCTPDAQPGAADPLLGAPRMLGNRASCQTQMHSDVKLQRSLQRRRGKLHLAKRKESQVCEDLRSDLILSFPNRH